MARAGTHHVGPSQPRDKRFDEEVELLSGSKLDLEERAAFAAIADLLIPAKGDKPSASEAGIAHELLDQLARLAPERIALIREVVDAARTSAPEQALDELRRTEPDAFALFTETVAGTYFMSDKVRTAIGYPGQEPVPARADEADLEDLLAPVRAGGFAPRQTERST